jgi:hypothetical protein
MRYLQVCVTVAILSLAGAASAAQDASEARTMAVGLAAETASKACNAVLKETGTNYDIMGSPKARVELESLIARMVDLEIEKAPELDNASSFFRLLEAMAWRLKVSSKSCKRIVFDRLVDALQLASGPAISSRPDALRYSEDIWKVGSVPAGDLMAAETEWGILACEGGRGRRMPRSCWWN